MHILKELITRDEHWGDEHSTIFCFHSDDLKLLRTPKLTEPWYYLFHSIPKCEVLDADGRTTQPCKGFLFHRLEQHGWSTTMDGSAACSSGAAVQWGRYNLPAQPAVHPKEFSTPVHSQELQQHHYPLFPIESPPTSPTFTPTIPTHLQKTLFWCFLKSLFTFLWLDGAISKTVSWPGMWPTFLMLLLQWAKKVPHKPPTHTKIPVGEEAKHWVGKG